MKQHSIQQHVRQLAGAANISWYFNQSPMASDLAASEDLYISFSVFGHWYSYDVYTVELFVLCSCGEWGLQHLVNF